MPDTNALRTLQHAYLYLWERAAHAWSYAEFDGLRKAERIVLERIAMVVEENAKEKTQ